MGTSLISNPPFNMKWDPPELAHLLPYLTGYPVPPKSCANFAFILKGLELADSKGVFILPTSVLNTTQSAEVEIKKRLLMRNLIDAVIMLPGSMFESTDIPACILCLNKNKQTTKVEMIDLTNRGQTVIREQRGQFGGASHTGRVYKKNQVILPDEVIEKTVEAIRCYQDIDGFSKAVQPEIIARNVFNLNPKLYVGYETIPERHRSFEDIAADYNRVINQMNSIRIRMNKTAAKRLDFDALDVERPDLSRSFEIVGQKCTKENFISFTADDGIRIECSTKNGIPDLIIMFLNHWKYFVMHWNNEQNRLLAEFRDALLPKLMSGEIKLEDETDD